MLWDLKDKKDIYKNITEYTKLLKLLGIRNYYSVSVLPTNAQKKYNNLKSLEFIKNAQNVILVGNPGIGTWCKCQVQNVEKFQNENA